MREISSNHYVFTFLGLRRIQFLNLMPNLQGGWHAVALVHSKDRHKPVPKELLSTANLLRATLHDQEMLSKFKNLQFEDSGWVANRWCELLPLSTQEKESLLMETDPQYRLSEVSKFLSQAGFS
jgi:Lon protease-like protein